jgi:hypothetical protein
MGAQQIGLRDGAVLPQFVPDCVCDFLSRQGDVETGEQSVTGERALIFSLRLR